MRSPGMTAISGSFLALAAFLFGFSLLAPPASADGNGPDPAPAVITATRQP